MKRIIVAALLSALLVATAGTALAAKPIVNERSQEEFLITHGDGPLDDPCLQEDILITGTMHYTEKVTEDPDGNIRTTRHWNPQGFSGIGVETGTQYRAAGMTKESFTDVNGEPEGLAVYNGPLIGQGKAPNSLLHVVIYFTGRIDEEGEPILQVRHETLACR